MNVLFEPWLDFQHPIVRQLAFCIASPNIIQNIPNELPVKNTFELHTDNFWKKQFSNYLPRLLHLDQNPAPLLEFVNKLKSTRLGLRVEYLFWFWLQDKENLDFELIQHSIQIIEGKNTLGEIDFLVRNRATQEIEQWEVALKYYLGESDLCLKHWYGLNRSDTLFRKLNHFSEKQFQFQQVLNLDINRKFAVMKGQLFIPAQLSGSLSANVSNSREQPTIPNWINPQRRMGQWGHSLLNPLYRLQRQEWICPNATQSSPPAQWWCNGLYHDHTAQAFYMFRQAPLIRSK